MIVVLGDVTVQPAKLVQALTLSREHVARSRTEPGCLSHAVHVDVDNPNKLVFVETWSDKAALDAHFKVPASHAFVRSLRDMATVAPSIAIYAAQQLGM